MAVLLTAGDRTILAMIDTGADTSVINETALQDFFPERIPVYEKVYSTFRAITGNEFTPLGRIEIKVDHCEPFKAIVVPNMMCHALIIGIDTLRDGNFTLNKDTLTWYGRRYHLYPYVNQYVNDYVGAIEVTPPQQETLNRLL